MPPWQYNDKLNHPSMRGGAESHYPVLDVEALSNLDVNSIAKNNSVLIMWATGPMMDGTSQKIIKKWGFKPKTMLFVWRKINKKKKLKCGCPTSFFGLGRYSRSSYEFVYIGTKGKGLKRERADIRQEVVWPIGRHSAKPPCVRDDIMRMFGRDKRGIELFARKPEETDFPEPYNKYQEIFRENWNFTGFEYDGLDIRAYLNKRLS